MKSYTDLKQSKKLAEILPFDSADMSWVSCDDGRQKYYQAENRKIILNYEKNHWLPCWSLAALLSIIPQELFDGEYIINITEGVNHKWIISYDPLDGISSYLSVSNDNLIDCCVEMIIKLKERNLL